VESPIAGAAFDRCQCVSGFALPMIPALGGHSQRRRHRNARPRGDRNAHLPRGKLETHLNTCHGGAPTRGTPPSQTASGTEGWPLSPCHSERAGRRPDASALPGEAREESARVLDTGVSLDSIGLFRMGPPKRPREIRSVPRRVSRASNPGATTPGRCRLAPTAVCAGSRASRRRLNESSGAKRRAARWILGRPVVAAAGL